LVLVFKAKIVCSGFSRELGLDLSIQGLGVAVSNLDLVPRDLVNIQCYRYPMLILAASVN